jgi:hypothetical protein
VGSLNGRVSKLEGRIQPPEDPGAAERRRQMIEALDALLSLLRREGAAINDRMAVLQEQGYSYQDAMTIAKDEVVRANNPELAEFFDQSYPPELANAPRGDPVAKREWLTSYIERRNSGSL